MREPDEALIEAESMVLEIEAAVIAMLGERLEDDFVEACRFVAEVLGRVVVCWIGIYAKRWDESPRFV